jgi:DNA-binding response OmpR family regulator
MTRTEPTAPHALVIDDDEVILESCRRTLERDGWTVHTESDGVAGRNRGLCGSYDLVLLDLFLPGIDGFELLAMLTAHRADTPVIVITGHSTVEAAVKAVKCGAVDFVPKPFVPEDLRARARACSRASSSATSRAPSPAPLPPSRACSTRPTAARCSWTRCRALRSRPRASCCACWKRAR